MTDREMLELAAKAAGYKVNAERQAERDASGHGDVGLWLTDGTTCWNPRNDDGQALRLAVKLRIRTGGMGDRACAFIGALECWEPEGGDPNAAMRRAILRAAASIRPIHA